MMDILQLIEALEKAEKPSRELDARIHALIYPDQMIMVDGGSVRYKTPATYAPIHTLDLSDWKDWEGIAGLFGVGRITASIDASVAFVERVLPGMLIRTLLNEGNMACKAKLCWMPNGLANEPKIEIEAWHEIEPLALCLAALRALQAKEG